MLFAQFILDILLYTTNIVQKDRDSRQYFIRQINIINAKKSNNLIYEKQYKPKIGKYFWI